ncbi:hypothetical protein DA2_1469 [Desulfovibrio sp. A2]|nr:hypothetical protein DA2_1469 [Desulfovibrio sp. A2]
MPRAWPLLIASIALGSGCAARPVPVVPPAPVVVGAKPCAAPPRPALPPVDRAMPFDAPANVDALLRRDDIHRSYAEALEAALACYKRQIPEGR